MQYIQNILKMVLYHLPGCVWSYVILLHLFFLSVMAILCHYKP